MATGRTPGSSRSPSSIAAIEFETVRRGYDPEAVRALLVTVDEEIDFLRRREIELSERLAAADSSAPTPLDDESIAAAVDAARIDAETVRVLQTARESANQIRMKAEQGASRILEEASEEAARVRSTAEIEAAALRQASLVDAAAEVEAAKQQGREMVAEARAYRDRVMQDLKRRHDAVAARVDDLVRRGGRLVDAFGAAHRAAAEVLAEIEPLVGDIEPLSTPVADERAPSAAPTTAQPVPVAPSDDHVAAAAVATETTDVVADESLELPSSDAVGGVVDDLFARLRASSDDGEREMPVDGEAPVIETTGVVVASDTAVFVERDNALGPLITAAARKLKRVLADEQNDLLGRLRTTKAPVAADLVLAPLDDRAQRFHAAIAAELIAAHLAGGSSVAGDAACEPDETSTLGHLVDERLVEPLHERLERGIAEKANDVEGIVKKVRAVYREYKTQHIDGELVDILGAAYGNGVLAAVAPGTPMCWAVDPDGPACPDAEDNALAGAVPAGEAYPTGHTVAPAHSGCRCLLVPASS